MPNILYTVIIYPIAQIIEFAFSFAQKLFKETGISVVFVSLVISVLCLPLYAVAEKWQQIERDIAKKLKPKIDKLKKVFRGDEQYMVLSTYYRQNHYHPIYALRSTFGLLIQIPFFIAAYSYLSNLELLKGVSFAFIKDLGAPDALFRAGNFSINVLPIVMTLVNAVAGAVYTKGFPIKDKVQLYGMAGIFLLLLYNSPSALVLYWTMNNVFSLIKNIYYAIPLKSKRYILVVLFSLVCLLLAFFCLTKLFYNSKAQKLAIVSIFAAVLPWLFILCRKPLQKIINIQYETGKTIPVFLTSLFLLWALFGLFLPSQLVASSPQEFSFIDNYTNPLLFLVITAAQAFGLFVFWPLCLFLLFSSGTKKYFSLFFLGLCLASMLNVFLFSGNYGVISVNFVFVNSPSHSPKEILLNIALIVLAFVVAVFLYIQKYKKIVPIFLSLCVFSLSAISVMNFISIDREFGHLKQYYAKEEKIEQINPIASLSRTGKNVVLIMLDRAISVFMPYIFDEYPDLKEKYSGFTFYPNTVSFNGYTSIGAPPVFGGYEYTPEEINKRKDVPLVEKHNQALIMLPLILSENGFSVCVTDPPYANYNWKSDLSIFDTYENIHGYITDSKYTDIWIREHGLKLPQLSEIIKRNMLWYSIVKGMPLMLRHPIYLDGNWCSPITSNSLRLTLNGYSVLDYLSRLIVITDDEKNTALIMTNNTTHEGSLLQAPEYTPSLAVANFGKNRFAKESGYHINAAAIKRLSEWFDYLKKENVYNNTRIIMVSDHGPEPNFITKNGLPFNVDQFNPLLMVKDFDASGELQTDMAFMSNADVPSFALAGLIDNPVNPFTGNAISMERKNDPLYIAISGSIHLQSGQASQFTLNPNKDYYIHDNIFDSKNWTPAATMEK